MLNDRFNDSNILRANRSKSLLTMIKKTSSNLRSLVSEIIKHTSYLAKLNESVQHWDSVLVYLIMNKLNFLTIAKWEYKKAKEAPKLERLLQFLKDRASLLEPLESNKSIQSKQTISYRLSQSTNTGPRIRSVVTNTITLSCSLCKEDNYIWICEKFLNLTREPRKQKLSTVKTSTRKNN